MNTKGKLATRAQWDAGVSPPWVVFLRDSPRLGWSSGSPRSLELPGAISIYFIKLKRKE